MIEGELRIGEFACNCNALQALPDGSLLLLLVCGDQENYVSQVARVSSDLKTVTPIFTVDTWILTVHFDQRTGKMFCSTAGGRILEIAEGAHEIVAEDIPFVSGFRSLSDGRLLAFGWHGLVMEYSRGWRRLDTGEKRRIFDLKEHGNQVFLCGDAGLFGRLDRERVAHIELQTNVRLRRLCGYRGALMVFSEAPVVFSFADGDVASADLPVAPAWDAVAIRDEILVGFGYHGLYRYFDSKLEQVSARRAFQIEPWGDKIAVLADSLLWIQGREGEIERTFHAEFSQLLERYGLV